MSILKSIDRNGSKFTCYFDSHSVMGTISKSVMANNREDLLNGIAIRNEEVDRHVALYLEKYKSIQYEAEQNNGDWGTLVDAVLT